MKETKFEAEDRTFIMDREKYIAIKNLMNARTPQRDTMN